MSIGLINNNTRIRNSVNSKNSTSTKETTTCDAFSKELEGFEAKVKNRLENGKPKYSLGMTSMTEEDWESLMDKVDSYMQKVRDMKDAEEEKMQDKQQKESIEERIYKKVLMMNENTNEKIVK